MGYEIVGESIKSAISIKLGQIFGNEITRYKEQVTNVKYPNFFINQVSVTPTARGRDRWEIDYLINIRYRHTEDTTAITNLEQKLDEVGLALCMQLTEINLELPVKTYNRSYEKVDGVCQFFCNIKIFVTTPNDFTKMQKLELNEEV